MTELQFHTLRAANVERADTTPAFAACTRWIPAQWIQSLVGEVGEAANVLKKIDRGDFTLEQARGEVAKELADVAIYLDLLAHKLGIDLGDAIVAKFNEVSDRVGATVRLSADGASVIKSPG